MNAKEWLNRGWKLNEEINSLLKKQQEALNSACSVTSSASGERVQTSANNSSERKILDYIHIGESINRKIDRLYKHKRQVMTLANKLDSISRKIVEYRYVHFKSWLYISKKINQPCNTARGRLHERAIREAEKYLKKRG